jgi:hypothetical protein
MLGGMIRRRTNFDPLAPRHLPTWLVTRDMFGKALEVTALAPHADLRAILRAAREARIAAGLESR